MLTSALTLNYSACVSAGGPHESPRTLVAKEYFYRLLVI